MNDHNDNDGPHGKDDRCDVSKLPIPLPANQTTLVQPTDQTLQLVTLGRGVQNYTCVNGTYVSAGALAE
jgi:hypothetical protein